MLKSLRKALHLGGPSATNQQDHAAGAPADNGSAENDSYTFELQCSSMAAASVPFGTTAGCVEVHDGASGGLLGSTGSCRPPAAGSRATGGDWVWDASEGSVTWSAAFRRQSRGAFRPHKVALVLRLKTRDESGSEHWHEYGPRVEFDLVDHIPGVGRPDVPLRLLWGQHRGREIGVEGHLTCAPAITRTSAPRAERTAQANLSGQAQAAPPFIASESAGAKQGLGRRSLHDGLPRATPQGLTTTTQDPTAPLTNPSAHDSATLSGTTPTAYTDAASLETYTTAEDRALSADAPSSLAAGVAGVGTHAAEVRSRRPDVITTTPPMGLGAHELSSNIHDTQESMPPLEVAYSQASHTQASPSLPHTGATQSEASQSAADLRTLDAPLPPATAAAAAGPVGAAAGSGVRDRDAARHELAPASASDLLPAMPSAAASAGGPTDTNVPSTLATQLPSHTEEAGATVGVPTLGASHTEGAHEPVPMVGDVGGGMGLAGSTVPDVLPLPKLGESVEPVATTTSQSDLQALSNAAATPAAPATPVNTAAAAPAGAAAAALPDAATVLPSAAAAGLGAEQTRGPAQLVPVCGNTGEIVGSQVPSMQTVVPVVPQGTKPLAEPVTTQAASTEHEPSALTAGGGKPYPTPLHAAIAATIPAGAGVGLASHTNTTPVPPPTATATGTVPPTTSRLRDALVSPDSEAELGGPYYTAASNAFTQASRQASRQGEDGTGVEYLSPDSEDTMQGSMGPLLPPPDQDLPSFDEAFSPALNNRREITMAALSDLASADNLNTATDLSTASDAGAAGATGGSPFAGDAAQSHDRGDEHGEVNGPSLDLGAALRTGSSLISGDGGHGAERGGVAGGMEGIPEVPLLVIGGVGVGAAAGGVGGGAGGGGRPRDSLSGQRSRERVLLIEPVHSYSLPNSPLVHGLNRRPSRTLSSTLHRSHNSSELREHLLPTDRAAGLVPAASGWVRPTPTTSTGTGTGSLDNHDVPAAAREALRVLSQDGSIGSASHTAGNGGRGVAGVGSPDSVASADAARSGSAGEQVSGMARGLVAQPEPEGGAALRAALAPTASGAVRAAGVAVAAATPLVAWAENADHPPHPLPDARAQAEASRASSMPEYGGLPRAASDQAIGPATAAPIVSSSTASHEPTAATRDADTAAVPTTHAPESTEADSPAGHVPGPAAAADCAAGSVPPVAPVAAVRAAQLAIIGLGTAQVQGRGGGSPQQGDSEQQLPAADDATVAAAAELLEHVAEETVKDSEAVTSAVDELLSDQQQQTEKELQLLDEPTPDQQPPTSAPTTTPASVPASVPAVDARLAAAAVAAATAGAAAVDAAVGAEHGRTSQADEHGTSTPTMTAPRSSFDFGTSPVRTASPAIPTLTHHALPHTSVAHTAAPATHAASVETGTAATPESATLAAGAAGPAGPGAEVLCDVPKVSATDMGMYLTVAAPRVALAEHRVAEGASNGSETSAHPPDEGTHTEGTVMGDRQPSNAPVAPIDWPEVPSTAQQSSPDHSAHGLVHDATGHVRVAPADERLREAFPAGDDITGPLAAGALAPGLAVLGTGADIHAVDLLQPLVVPPTVHVAVTEPGEGASALRLPVAGGGGRAEGLPAWPPASPTSRDVPLYHAPATHAVAVPVTSTATAMSADDTVATPAAPVPVPVVEPVRTNDPDTDSNKATPSPVAPESLAGVAPLTHTPQSQPHMSETSTLEATPQLTTLQLAKPDAAAAGTGADPPVAAAAPLTGVSAVLRTVGYYTGLDEPAQALGDLISRTCDALADRVRVQVHDPWVAGANASQGDSSKVAAQAQHGDFGAQALRGARVAWGLTKVAAMGAVELPWGQKLAALGLLPVVVSVSLVEAAWRRVSSEV